MLFNNYFNFLLILAVTTLPKLVFGSCPNIISRAQWHASPAKQVTSLKFNPAPFVVVHHSAGPACSTSQSCKNTVKAIQNYHMSNRGWEDIGYNFLIGGDGSILEGRGWGVMGAHLPKYNSKSVGICLLGNFMSGSPSQEQLNSLKQLIECANDSGYLKANYDLIGHRQGGATSCPGDRLFNEIRRWPHFNPDIKRQ